MNLISPVEEKRALWGAAGLRPGSHQLARRTSFHLNLWRSGRAAGRPSRCWAPLNRPACSDHLGLWEVISTIENLLRLIY